VSSYDSTVKFAFLRLSVPISEIHKNVSNCCQVFWLILENVFIQHSGYNGESKRFHLASLGNLHFSNSSQINHLLILDIIVYHKPNFELLLI